MTPALKRRNALTAAPLAAALALAGCAVTNPLEETRYASCEAARTAVQQAGQDGVQFAHERVYNNDTCFYDGISFEVFTAVREIDGQVCNVGFVCIEQTSGTGGI